MSLLIAENVAHAFGAHTVLRDVNFRLAETDRIGLVGANGEGKTTLLRIVAGLLEPSAGDVHRRQNLRIGYLPQDQPVLEGTTVHDAMLGAFADLRRKEAELQSLAARIDTDRAALRRYTDLQHEFDTLGGFNYQNRIEQALSGLGFERDLWPRPLSQLSGGQRTRAYLAKLLVQDHDLLLLDEPTNHLDLEACEWLESRLACLRCALLVVSHDRYLLDRVTASTWELAAARLETYKGAYTKFLTLRSDRYNERLRGWQAQQEYIAKTEEFIRIHMGSQRTNEAKGRRTRLERFLRDEAVEKPLESRSIRLAIPAGPRTGDLVLRAVNAQVGHNKDNPLFRAKDLTLERGWRVAIVGPNGCGKTTLLRTLLGELPPLDGEVRLGARVLAGYLTQTGTELDPNASGFDAVFHAGRGKGCTPEHARSLLGGLLLSGDEAFKPVDQLSGGQRSRVAFARLEALKPNLLVLDEPTNHLDIPSMEVVQETLKEFDGTLLFVSHDRYLIDALATHVWVIEGGEVHCMAGGWERFVRWREERRARGRDETHAAEPDRAKDDRKAGYRLTRKEANRLQRLRRRLTELEKDIDRTEQDLARLNAAITTAAESGATPSLLILSREHQEKTARLAALWTEWERVGEQLE